MSDTRKADEPPVTTDDLSRLIGDDPNTFSDGVIVVCAGEWRRLPDGRWQWWEVVDD